MKNHAISAYSRGTGHIVRVEDRKDDTHGIDQRATHRNMDNRDFGFVGPSFDISEIRQNCGPRCAECGCWLLPVVGYRRYLWRECFGRA